MTNTELKLSPPWMTYCHEFDALFGDDPEVQVVWNDDDDQKSISLYVKNAAKADALTRLLPTEKTFGNVVVKIKVIPANKEVEPSMIELMETAFKGNPAFSYAASVSDLFPINYVVFANKVVQFYNDQLDDPHGVVSTLYQTIAKDVFENVNGVYFCTDLPVETK
jgi:hypothetical protein